MTDQRDITSVIDQIIAIAPELTEELSKIRYDALYTAPELMHIRWGNLASVIDT